MRIDVPMNSTNDFPGWKRYRMVGGHWTCFMCRKMFRKPGVVRPRCPQCRGEMTDMGPYFEPPRRSDLKMWKAMRDLAEAVYRFYSEGSRASLFTAGRRGD